VEWKFGLAVIEEQYARRHAVVIPYNILTYPIARCYFARNKDTRQEVLREKLLKISCTSLSHKVTFTLIWINASHLKSIFFVDQFTCVQIENTRLNCFNIFFALAFSFFSKMLNHPIVGAMLEPFERPTPTVFAFNICPSSVQLLLNEKAQWAF